MEEGTSTPVLRFCGFSEDWRIVRLGSVLTILNGFAFSSSHAVESGVRWVKIADVGIHKMKKGNLSYLPVSFTRSHSKFILKKGDCVIALTRPILNSRLKIAMIDDEFDGALLNQRVGKIITSNHLPFIYYLLQQDRLVTIIESNIAGSDPPNLSPNEINGIQVTVPILAEQQKIAAFLTAVDNKIQLLEKKKVLLEQYKKGVMQKIFSREIRFKDDDGKEFPDWEEKFLSEIGETYNGLVGKSKEDFGHGAPFVTYKQIFDNASIDLDRFQYVKVGSKEKQNEVRFGDVFFTTSSETPNEIGYSSVLLEQVDNLYLNSFCFGYRIHSFSTLSPFYAKFLFRSSYFRMMITKLAQGSTRYNMSKVELLKLRVKLPSYEEQTKVANFLSAVEHKIKRITTQLTLTREYKKGLLQQMFV